MRSTNSQNSRVLYVASFFVLAAFHPATAEAAGVGRLLVSHSNFGEPQRGEQAPASAVGREMNLRLQLRSRAETDKEGSESKVVHRTVRWDPKKTAIIVCDMWNDHTCKGAAGRVAEMAPAVDQTINAARGQGVLIIHAPSGTMSVYEHTPQRRRARNAPPATAPVEIKWNHWDPDREGNPLPNFVDGGCACPEPCPNFRVDEDGIRHWKRGEKLPWSRQIKAIGIAQEDAISDNGQEIYNLLEQRGIDNVILMGVHTNICVCGRPFGLRQMTYFKKNVALCRDLTDALFQAKSADIDQFRGTALVVEHIEKRICPTIISSSITGQPEFRFKGDVAGR